MSMGARWSPDGTSFAVSAPEATGVELCLFDGDRAETRHPLTGTTSGVWRTVVPALSPGQAYGFRADGPWDPSRGRLFNASKLLLDPYARAVSGSVVPDPAIYAENDADSAPYVPRSVLVDDDFDWGDERSRPRVPWTDTVLYELHVKGFTMTHPDVPPELRGTYAGLACEPVGRYLRDLGVTSVELLPVHQHATEPWLTATGLSNYWGYNSIGFFAPHHGYSSSGDRGGQVGEFKSMVKALHAAGLEVILDVVYNHTAEAGPLGPTLSLRGLDDAGFYAHLAPDGHDYFDVTGCGNTVDASYPPALRLILDSLRYWVTEMHVDGFRFDLASALTRSRHRMDLAGDLLTAVGQDPVLRGVKLVAEPWDATAEGYAVGRFPAPWREWNDRYRDAVRDFWRLGSGGARDLAHRVAGSSDLYADRGRSPYASVNFVTAHDGFTLRDLVSYDHKHNDANLEDNRDGTSDNRSWNCGVEGETDDPGTVELRHRQAANLLATLCLSVGVPMITAGDERGRTQGGNNNAYSQDNETSWVDWSPESSWDDLRDVVRTALRLRREHAGMRPQDLSWIHPEGRAMTPTDWHDDRLHTLGVRVAGERPLVLWLNARPEPAKVRLPDGEGLEAVEVVLSTDANRRAGEQFETGDVICLDARSLLVLRSR
jgi:glycogen debranching enzyme GlgX